MSDRTKAYQGLRLIFFISIVAMHCGHEICGDGAALCSFFYVISGLLYNKKNDFIAYIKKKITTIFPIYYFCLILFILGRGFRGHLHLDWDIIPFLFMVQSWIPSSSFSSIYLGPAWFLSSLFFCYVVSPLCWKVIDKYRCNYTLVVIFAILLVIIHCIDFGELNEWMHYRSPILRFIEYSSGMALGSIIKPKTQKEEPFTGCILIIILLYLSMIKWGGLGWYCVFLHMIVLSIIWLYKSKYTNIVLGNCIVLKLAPAGLFIYLSHNVIKMAIPGNWYTQTVSCVIIGFILNEIYQYLLTKVKFK